MPEGFGKTSSVQYLIHSDDVHEVERQGCSESANLPGIQEEGPGVCGSRNHSVVGEDDKLEQRVVSATTHVGQRQRRQNLCSNFTVFPTSNHLQKTARITPSHRQGIQIIFVMSTKKLKS